MTNMKSPVGLARSKPIRAAVVIGPFDMTSNAPEVGNEILVLCVAFAFLERRLKWEEMGGGALDCFNKCS
jgi:hypothetical protein